MLWRPICIASTRSLVEVAVKPFDQKTDIARSSTSSRSNSLGLAMDGTIPRYGLKCQITIGEVIRSATSFGFAGRPSGIPPRSEEHPHGKSPGVYAFSFGSHYRRPRGPRAQFDEILPQGRGRTLSGPPLGFPFLPSRRLP